MDHRLHHQWNTFLLQRLAGSIPCYCHYQVCNLMKNPSWLQGLECWKFLVIITSEMIPRRESFECVVKYYQISHGSCQEKFENVTTNDIDGILQSQCPQVTSQMNSTGHCTPISRNEKTYWAVILFIGILLPIFVTMCAYTFLFREVKTVRRAVSSFDKASIMRKSAISSAKGILHNQATSSDHSQGAF